MLHALAAVGAHVGDNAVAAFIDAQLFAQLRNNGVDVAQQRGVISVRAAADTMCCWR